jgi:hypothetical protein
MNTQLHDMRRKTLLLVVLDNMPLVVTKKLEDVLVFVNGPLLAELAMQKSSP